MTDLVVQLPHLPARGAQVAATAFGMFLGGKGFNQALAARRMGASVSMIGRVGDDDFGRRHLAALDAAGIDRRCVVRDQAEGSGIALPLVEPDGTNSIIIAPRANMRLTVGDVEAAAADVAGADVLLLQLETPTEASIAAARIARASGCRVLLNPAPVMPLPEDLLRLAHIVTPNEVEATALSGERIADVAGACRVAEVLRSRGPEHVVVTLGALGAVHAGPEGVLHVPPLPVTAIDTTAAGDAFSGALAVRLAETGDMAEALHWAAAAGALAVTRLGAEPSLPHRPDVEHLLRTRAGG